MPLPPLDMLLPRQDLQVNTSPAQLDVLPSGNSRTAASIIPIIHFWFTTQPNSFRLYHIYDEQTLPISDPDDYSSDGHTVSQTSPTSDPGDPSCDGHAVLIKDQYMPYPNKSSFLLGEWYWNQGSQTSQSSFRKLLDIVSGPGF